MKTNNVDEHGEDLNQLANTEGECKMQTHVFIPHIS